MKVRPNTFIGSAVERVEDLRFLRGRGQFVDDLVRKEQWHCVVVRSAVAHGVIRTIATEEARALAGVRAVITGKDIVPLPTIPFRRPSPAIAPYAQPVMASDIVRYVGEPVALVLADSAAIAEDAVQRVIVDIDERPVVVSHQDSARGEPLLFAATDTNCATVYTASQGDVTAAFAAAACVVRGCFRVQRLSAMPMETRGLLAEWDDATQRLSVAGAAKIPFFNRRAMAAMMDLPEESIDYVEYDVGGGFGARGEFYPEDFLVAFSARKFGRPIKWVEDRREHFMAIAHSRETECDVEMAFARDGAIIGVRGDIYVDVGAYVRPNGMTPARNVAQFLTGPYRVPATELRSRAFVTNKTPSGTYRGPGRYEGCFFCERLIDMGAAKLGLDRLEIRRRNLIAQHEMPYALVPVRPNDGFNDTSCDSGDYASAFDRCVAEAGWRDKEKLDGQCIDGLHHGLGIACFIEGGASGPRENARAVLEPTGDVAIFVGSSAIGQGLETIMTQIAADSLEIPPSRIRILHGSTTYLAEGFGSYGSRSTVMGGNAVVVASANLLEKFRAIAAERLLLEPGALSLREGVAYADDGRSVRLEDVADASLFADGTFSNSKNTYTYGTAVAHVAVDARTGKVTVVDYIVVDDVGRIINPLTLHGQVLGAAVQGMGSVFTEEIPYDENGQILVGSLADYMIPVATDYPHVRAISLEQHPSPNNPLGAKGAGEGGIIPVGGAIANAVASALSAFHVRTDVLPLSPPRVWELIQAGIKSST